MIDQDELKEVINYDPETGIFTWKKQRGRAKPGEVAGYLRKTGYIDIGQFNIKAHRLAFLYMTGSIPDLVDHINGIKNDNRWGNLRSANTMQNSHNCKMRRNNTSGIKGVSWHKDIKKWRVSLSLSGIPMHFGYWDDLEAAELVSILAREKYHGEFANHGGNSAI